MRLLADITPLRIAAYRRLWTAWTVANLGQQMAAVAIAISVYDVTKSSLAVGAVGLFQFVPLVILGLYGGALADHFDRRKLAGFANIGLFIVSLLLLAQAVLDLQRLWILYVCVALQAAMIAISNPARAASVPKLIGTDLLKSANALSQVAINTAMTVGPLVGGAIIAATSDVVWVFAIDSVAFLGVLYAVFKLPPLPPDRDENDSTTRVGITKILEGIRFLKGKRNVQMSFYIDIVAMVLGMPRALFPAIAASWYADNALAYSTIVGLLSAAPAIGALLAGLFSGPLHHVHRHGLAVYISVLGWGFSIAAFGAVSHLWLAVLFLALAGAADAVSAVFRGTILQAAVQDQFRGRLQGIFMVVVAGGPRLGDLESGTVAELFSERVSVITGGIGCVILATILVMVVPSFLKYDGRNPTP